MEARKTQTSIRYQPLKYFVAYILATLILFFVLPIQYHDLDALSVLGFMIAFICVFVFCYMIGTKRESGDYSGSNYYEHSILRIVKISIVITFGLYVWVIIARLEITPVELTSPALIDFGSTYRNAVLSQARLPVIPSVQALTFMSPIVEAAFILGMYYFEKLPIGFKGLLGLTFAVYLLNNILFFATQKDIGDIVIYAFSVAMIRDAKFGARMKRLMLLSILCIIIPGFFYTQQSRLLAFGGRPFAHQLITVDYNNYLYRMFGYDTGVTLLILGGYVSKGYYGLALSLRLPFRWTYGIGSSFALMSYAQQYFGIQVLYDTYPLRMQMATGWPGLQYWHTIFPWLASDLTFVGALIYMGIVAFVYAKVWRESLLYANPLAILLFSNITIMLLFVPANNQLMQTRGSTIAWLAISVVWLIFHRKLNRRSEQGQNEPGILNAGVRRRMPGLTPRQEGHNSFAIDREPNDGDVATRKHF